MPGAPSHRLAAAPGRGVTIVELFIVVAIVAIIAAIALPSYKESMQRTRRAEAVAALAAVQQAQERFRNNSSTYAGSLGSLPGGGFSAATKPNGYYQLSLADVEAASYTVVATATAGKAQAQDSKCVKLYVRIDGGIMKYGSTNSGGTNNEAEGNPCWAR
jgi:type IV pilus assembly protein PilE